MRTVVFTLAVVLVTAADPAPTVFSDSDVPVCFVNEKGHTIVRYNPNHEHGGFKCTHTSGSCACTLTHPTKEDGHCIEFDHTDGITHHVRGTCLEPASYPMTHSGSLVYAPFEANKCARVVLTDAGTAAVNAVYFRVLDHEGLPAWCQDGSSMEDPQQCIFVGTCNSEDPTAHASGEPDCWGVTNNGELAYYAPGQRSNTLPAFTEHVNQFNSNCADDDTCALAGQPTMVCDRHDYDADNEAHGAFCAMDDLVDFVSNLSEPAKTPCQTSLDAVLAGEEHVDACACFTQLSDEEAALHLDCFFGGPYDDDEDPSWSRPTLLQERALCDAPDPCADNPCSPGDDCTVETWQEHLAGTHTCVSHETA